MFGRVRQSENWWTRKCQQDQFRDHISQPSLTTHYKAITTTSANCIETHTFGVRFLDAVKATLARITSPQPGILIANPRNPHSKVLPHHFSESQSSENSWAPLEEQRKTHLLIAPQSMKTTKNQKLLVDQFFFIREVKPFALPLLSAQLINYTTVSADGCATNFILFLSKQHAQRILGSY